MTKLVVVNAEELRHLIKEAVTDALLNGSAPDEWVDAHSSGLGRRTFLRLAREGAFPVSKVGKRHVARRADVAAYVERQRVQEQGGRRNTSRRPTAQRARTLTDNEPSSPEVDDPVARALAQGRLRVLKGSP